MKADVVVMGGGFAGIAAAAALAEQGRSVVVLERRRLLGGRACSFQDPASGEEIDNGQHLLMGCYRNTLELLEKIGTRDQLKSQESLQVEFLDDKGKIHELDCSRGPGVLGLLLGLLSLSSISVADKLRLIFLLPSIFLASSRNRQTVSEWLDRTWQSPQIQKHFWEPLCLASLNESPDRAAADLLKVVLREAFRGSKKSSALLFPMDGLSELTGEKAMQYLEARGGRVFTRLAVTRLQLDADKVAHAEFLDGKTIEAGAFISALPPAALAKILPAQFKSAHPSYDRLDQFQTSPILSIHLWLSKPLTDRPFLALLNSPIHWVFNRELIQRKIEAPYHPYSLIVSGAHDLAKFSNLALQTYLERELARYFPHFEAKQIQKIKIIKELEATILPSPEMQMRRLGTKTAMKNLFLAGDWTATGLPATIESAVVSGKLAAAEALKYLNASTASEEKKGKISAYAYRS